MMELTYRLEGVVRTKDEYEDFEGPLTLILMLLSKNKIEIRDIKISDILSQYLEYLAKMEEMDLEVTGEFVQMAAHLMYLKTRTLLESEEQVSELELLMSSLEQLRCKDAFAAIKTVTPELLKASEKGALLFGKPPEPLPPGKGVSELKIDGPELLEALFGMLLRGAPSQDAGVRSGELAPLRVIYGIREKSLEIIDLLQKSGRKTLRELCEACQSRSELVAAFLSVLELCAAGRALVSRSEEGEYTVSLTGSDEGVPDEISEY